MESVDVSQSDSTNSLVPEMGQQGGNSLSNPLQFPSPESTQPASGEASSISDDAALNAATWFAKEQLDSFASDEDFLSNMEQAFGDNWHPEQAEDLIQNLASGDAMPEVKVMPGSDLKANGAFGEDTIYLSEEFLSGASSELVSGGLIEEIGHFVDQELNSGDSSGDEGDIFQQLVEDKAISDSELVDLKAEDDSGTVALGGEEFSVETAYYPNTLILKQLTAKDIIDHPRWDGEDEPRVTVYPNGSGVNPNGSGIEYEFYSEGEGKGMSIGETKSFQSTGKNNYLSADSNFIDFDLHEKDSNGYNWIDFGTETNTKGDTDSFVFFSERGEADNIEEADYVLRFQIT